MEGMKDIQNTAVFKVSLDVGGRKSERRFPSMCPQQLG